MTIQELAQCARADLEASHPGDLVDLNDISIDSGLPRHRRMADYLDQIKNPYLFQIDGTVVKVQYGSGKSLTASLISLLDCQQAPELDFTES